MREHVFVEGGSHKSSTRQSDGLYVLTSSCAACVRERVPVRTGRMRSSSPERELYDHYLITLPLPSHYWRGA